MKIDLSIPEFVTLFNSIFDHIVKYHITSDYRIAIKFLPNSVADIDIYPSSSEAH